MATGVYSWSTTAGDNAGADSSINYAEGQAPASLNNSARAQMAVLRAWFDGLGGNITYGGTGNAYTATNAGPGAWVAYGQGRVIGFVPNATNSGAATLNVDGLGARTIKKSASTDVAAGDLVSGAFYLLRDNGTNFQLTGGPAASFQPLDATLTALAALSWSAGNALLQATAADTFSLTLTPSVTSVAASNGAGATTPAARFTNTTDGADVCALAIAGDRATPAANDIVYMSFELSDSLGNQEEFGRIAMRASAVSNGTEDSRFFFYTRAGGTVAIRAQMTNNLFSPTTNDGMAFGNASLGWSDLFGASGFTFNCNNGNAILTHVTGGFDQTAGGFAAPPLASSETGGTLTSASRNRRVVCASAPTLPASGMTAGDWILIDPAGTARAVSRPAAHTMYVRDSDVASDDTYAHNVALAVYHGSSKWTLHGMP